jgi:hypothetical protein
MGSWRMRNSILIKKIILPLKKLPAIHNTTEYTAKKGGGKNRL